MDDRVLEPSKSASDILGEFAAEIQSKEHISVAITRDMGLEGRTTAMHTKSSHTLAISRPDRFSFLLKSGPIGLNIVRNRNKIHTWMVPPIELGAIQGEISGNSTELIDESMIGKLNTTQLTSYWLCPSIIANDPSDHISSHFGSISYKGIGTIEGASCYHLTMQHPEFTLEVWITTGETRLLRRVIANWVNNSDETKMTTQVDYTDWKFDPVDEEIFTIPSPHATKPSEK